MKKNIEWLRRKIHKELESWHGVEGGIDEDGINEIMLLINQLDEQEVLSQEWIDEHKFNIDTYDEVINVDDLQNLLVPKQEREQKYYVDLDTAAYVAKWGGDGSVQIYTDSVSGSDEYELYLTEQEIKGYDERFWAFAEPVEELEE